MGSPLLRYGRAITIAVLGTGIGLLQYSPIKHPFISIAAAASKPADDPQEIDAADTLELTGLQQKFEAVGKRVAPAVVAISAAETPSDSDSAVRSEDLNTQKLQDLLDRTTRTVGTGFIFDSEGYILTNEHVVEDSQQFWVTMDDQKVYPAIVVAADPRADLAVLKIPASHLPTVKFSRTGVCERGQWTITLGNPYGLATEGDMAMSVGVISATERSLPKLASKENRLYSNLIQTTAQINPGNSGGPLFDINGNVIGINTAVILPQKQTNGIGFAIPVTPQLLAEVNALRQGREIVYAYVGVTVTTPTQRERSALGIDGEVGVRVESIEANSPASVHDALAQGDIVMAINDQAIGDSDHFVRLIGAAAVDKASSLRVLRDGKMLSIKVTPVKRPLQYAVSSQSQRMRWRGMILGPVPANWLGAKSDHTACGVLVVGLDSDCPLRKKGVNTGSVITAIAGHPVATLLELQAVLNDVLPEQCEVQLANASTLAMSTAK
jgi:serine protease Do